MNVVWKVLCEKVGKSAKVPKFHDSMHKNQRIRLFGPTSVTCTRSFEKYHYFVVKLAFLLTNRKNVIPQLITQVILFFWFCFLKLFLFCFRHLGGFMRNIYQIAKKIFYRKFVKGKFFLRACQRQEWINTLVFVIVYYNFTIKQIQVCFYIYFFYFIKIFLKKQLFIS